MRVLSTGQLFALCIKRSQITLRNQMDINMNFGCCTVQGLSTKFKKFLKRWRNMNLIWLSLARRRRWAVEINLLCNSYSYSYAGLTRTRPSLCVNSYQKTIREIYQYLWNHQQKFSTRNLEVEVPEILFMRIHSPNGDANDAEKNTVSLKF